MKNYTQVYVKNSAEAARHYCDAFGAEITREFWNEDKTAYARCELSVKGDGFLALAEAEPPCDVAFVHRMKWETMKRLRVRGACGGVCCCVTASSHTRP